MRTMGRTAAAALLAGTALAQGALAGGIERSNQSLGILFETGRVAEFGLAGVQPNVDGRDVLGFPTGDVTKGYGGLGFSYKQDFTDQLSGAVILDSPFGADVVYPTAAEGGSPLLGGTSAIVDSINLTGVLRYKTPSGFGVHGGLRLSVAEARVQLSGLAYGAVDGYRVTTDRSTALGWLAGVNWEREDIAARVALTYNSPVEHDFEMTESFAANPALGPLAGATLTDKSTVRTPRSVNLEFQTGVAPDTLVFGSVRWVKWSEFKVRPKYFSALPGLEDGLVDLPDTTTWTLGVGRKFTEAWSGSASFSYEAGEESDLVSPLAPTNGRKAITLAAIWTQGNVKVTTGLNYTWLGDAQPETGTPDTARATMTDNHALAGGVRVQVRF